MACSSFENSLDIVHAFVSRGAMHLRPWCLDVNAETLDLTKQESGHDTASLIFSFLNFKHFSNSNDPETKIDIRP